MLNQLKIEIIFTCFNRISKTSSCVSAIVRELELLKLDYHMTVLDCGSDGTGDYLQLIYPDRVKILKGTTEIYWGEGMAILGESIKEKNFDYLLPINDDVILYENIMHELMIQASNEHVVVGAFEDKNGCFSYGARKMLSHRRPLKFDPVLPSSKDDIVTGNMNLIIIPKSIFKKFGFIDRTFRHRGGDYDLLLRYSENNVSLSSSKKYIGICDRNAIANTSRDKNLPISVRLKKLISIKEGSIRERYIFARRYGGNYFLLEFLRPFVRCLI